MTEPIGFATWQNQTTLHPAGFAAIVILGLATLFVPRRWAVAPMLVAACFIAPAQRLVVFTLDFNMLRLLVLFGWARVTLRRETVGFRWRAVDWVVLLLAAVRTGAYTIQRGETGALIYMLGESFDAVGMYFLFRILVRSWEDALAWIRAFVVLSVPVLIAFTIENRTGRNIFSALGGVPSITQIREGRMRCQGAFAHPILAGTFWAALLPMMVALWWRPVGRDKVFAVGGTVCGLGIVALSASSTPVAAVGLAIIGASFWPLRHWMGWVRAGLAFTLVFLHLSMDKPVWHLIARIDIVGGSTGWHRYFLFDQAIRHMNEWALVGSPSTETWGIVDITNQYVLEGLRGGLATVALFVLVIALVFRDVGGLWRSVRAVRWKAVLAWSLGVALFVHVMAFFAVSYFGQIIVIWHLLLATIVSLRTAQLGRPMGAR